MPTFDDYDPNDPEAQTGSSGSGVGGSSGSTSGAGKIFGGASQQHEAQYTPWGRFVSANSGVSDREAGKLNKSVTDQAQAAQAHVTQAQNKYLEGIDSQYAQPEGNGLSRQQKSDQGPRPFGGSQEWASFGANAQPAPVAAPLRSTTQDGLSVSPMVSQGPLGAAQARSAPGMAPGKKVSKPAPTSPALKHHDEPAPVAPAPPDAPSNFDGALVGAMKTVPRISDEAVRSGAKGPKDLEGSMTPEAWSSLVSGSVGAEQAANALKTPGGIEALLQKQAAAPTNSAFDAALIGGAGQKSFNDTANTYGGGKTIGQLGSAEQASQDAWSKLTGDVKKGQEWQQKQSDIERANKALADQAAGQVKQGPADPSSAPGYESRLDSFKKGGNQSPTSDKTGGHNRPDITTKEGFLGYLANAAAGQKQKDYKDVNGKTNEQVAKDLMAGLDVDWKKLAEQVSKMTPDEYAAFMATGTIPEWFQTGPKSTAKKGVPNGVNAYYQLGSDGMWRNRAEALSNTEKAQKAAGDPIKKQAAAEQAAAQSTMDAAGGILGGPWYAAYKAIAGLGNTIEDSEEEARKKKG